MKTTIRLPKSGEEFVNLQNGCHFVKSLTRFNSLSFGGEFKKNINRFDNKE